MQVITKFVIQQGRYMALNMFIIGSVEGLVFALFGKPTIITRWQL